VLRSGDPTDPCSTPCSTRGLIDQEKAFQITSTAENSTVNWWDTYATIEDIRDGRGYTGGIVGFTSATGDMLELVEQYVALQPDHNVLAPYVAALRSCTRLGETVDDAEYGVDGGRASHVAGQQLGPSFLAAWAHAAHNDPIFRRVQRGFRRDMYWAPAYDAAVADGVGALGQALYYDTSVNHGPGAANSNDGSFDDIRSRTVGTAPSRGGAERRWLTAFIDRRSEVLTLWGDNPIDGRIAMFRELTDSGNWALTPPFSWSIYGDAFRMPRDPTPRND